MSVKVLEFSTSQEAWEGINEYLFLQEQDIYDRGGIHQGTQVLSYDVMLRARRAMVDPEFDFADVLGYTTQKWNSLVNNYINFNYLDILKGQILAREKKGNQNYNESMLFDNSHTSGKGCLLSLTISRRYGQLSPVLTFSLRASEVTKRLLFDLLLIQRVGEYIYGEGADFGLQLYCPNVYLDVASFSMYDNHRPFKKLMENGEPKGRIQRVVMKYYDNFKKADIKEITYRSHLRIVEQIQKDENGNKIHVNKKPLLAKDLTLDIVEHDLPEELVTPKEIRAFKRKKTK